jgi:Tfp pilus assembly protein PilF
MTDPKLTLALTRPTFDALVGWGAVLYRGGAFDQALPFFRLAHAGFPDEPLAQKLLASCYQQIGYKRQATELYRASLKRDPKQTDVLANLAEILIAQMRYQEALELLERAIALDPEYRDAHAQRARALVMQVIDQLESR